MVDKKNRITATVNENLDFKFRKLASYKFKFKRGWFSIAINEAISNWIDENKDYDIFIDESVEDPIVDLEDNSEK